MTLAFELLTEICPSCGKRMMHKINSDYFHRVIDNQESQMKQLGVVFISQSKIDDGYICVECEAQGKASFVCALCGERHSSDNIQYSVGDPSEYLCKTCYSTVPAKAWEEKVEELDATHRWNYE